MFYVGRYSASGGNRELASQIDARWQSSRFHFSQRLVTAIWVVAFLAEALIRIILVLVVHLPVTAILLISPIIGYAVIAAVLLWTITYARTSARKGAELQAQVLQIAATHPGDCTQQ